MKKLFFFPIFFSLILSSSYVAAQGCTQQEVKAYRQEIRYYQKLYNKANKQAVKTERSIGKLTTRADRAYYNIGRAEEKEGYKILRLRQRCDIRKHRLDSIIDDLQVTLAMWIASCVLDLNLNKCVNKIQSLTNKINRAEIKYDNLSGQCLYKEANIVSSYDAKIVRLIMKWERAEQKLADAVQLLPQLYAEADWAAGQLAAVEAEYLARCGY